jgi:RecA-family ATPase
MSASHTSLQIQSSLGVTHSPGSGHQVGVWGGALDLRSRGVSEEDALKRLQDEWSNHHKDIGAAVERAVRRVYSGQGSPRGNKRKKWPKPEAGLISAIVEESELTPEEFRKASPCPNPDKFPCWGLLRLLFPDKSLLCMGKVNSFSTKPLEEFASSNENLPQIVPRTMASRYGVTQEGNPSQRCNDNVGPERYVVVEFDKMDMGIQVPLIHRLSGYLPLVLAMHSGNESLHGWYNAVGASEEQVNRFKRYAAALGADTQVFVPSQMVRMPNQTRPENGNLQRLLYFDNGMLPSKAEGEVVIDFAELSLAPEIGVDEDPPRSSPRIEEWHDFVANCPPEPPELIEGFLHEGCKAALAGQSKAGKSHLAKQLAHAVATGSPFLGMDTLKTPVLYLNLELPKFAFRKRFSALMAKTGIPVEVEFFHLVSGRGTWNGIQDLDAMIDRIIELGVKLIIVDPLYKVADLDESDQAAIKGVLRVFDQVVEETGASLLYVHHFGKGNAKDRNAIDLLSGSGVLARDYDSCLLLLDRGEGKSLAKFILRNHEPKDDLPLANDYPLKIPDESAIGGDGGRLGVTEEASTSERYSVDDVLFVLEPEEEVASKDLRERVEEECGMGKSTFHSLVREAAEDGLLSSRKVSNRKLYSLPTVVRDDG